MGMSSSQARLLNLTTRMHQIEYKAAKIEAEKLQLANKSRQAYLEYQNAMEQTKIQFKSIAADASFTYKDATMNILQNGIIPNYSEECAPEPLFLQNMDGKIMVTEAVARAFDLDRGAVDPDMDNYIRSVTGKDKASREVIVGNHLEPTDKIDTVSTVQNRKINDPSDISYTYTPIGNQIGGSPIQSVKFDNFVYDPGHKDTTGLNDITSLVDEQNNITITSDEIKDNTYVINNEAGLKALQKLCASGIDTSNVTFIVGQDFAMSDNAGWSGINDFKGNFDGNGYTISNLNGTKGLFKKTGSTAKIENLKLEISNITCTTDSYSEGNGGLIGTSEQGTVVNNCVIDIKKMETSTWTGGIVGAGGVTITNCSANIDDLDTTYSCVGGIIGHGSNEKTINIENCYVSGTINDSKDKGHRGGIFGHNDKSAKAIIKDCTVNVKINSTVANTSGAIFGKVNNSQNYTIQNVTYNKNLNDSMKICGNNDKFQNNQNDTNQFVQMITTPSIDPNNNYKGSFYSNIYGALHKYAKYDESQINSSNITEYIRNLSSGDNGKFQVANVNEYICKYLNGDLTDDSFIEALYNDVKNRTITNTTSTNFQNIWNGNNSSLTISNVVNSGDMWSPVEHVGQKGEYRVPTTSTMAQELYYLLLKDSQQNGTNEISQETINSWFNKYNTNNEADKISLANLNDCITSGNIAQIRDYITGNEKYENIANYNTFYYDINLSANSTPNITYVQRLVDDCETQYYWDTNDTDIANAMAMWIMAQKGVIIVNNEQASSKEYLTNIINGGYAIFTSFEPKNAEQLSELSTEEILHLSNAEYEEIMEIENTSIATNTSLQEVEDETNLRKAEAKYEADMRRIDMKDRKYDYDLAALESERNAIKQEMETLKTVIKDNIERTFKLFG